MMKILGLALLALAVYLCLHIGTLGLLEGLGGSVLALALGLALAGSRS